MRNNNLAELHILPSDLPHLGVDELDWEPVVTWSNGNTTDHARPTLLPSAVVERTVTRRGKVLELFVWGQPSDVEAIRIQLNHARGFRLPAG